MCAGDSVFSFISSEAIPRGATRRRVRAPVVAARGGDLAAIYHFLTAVFQGPSRAEFKASLEDPFYSPRDRLLIRRGGRILAHAHLTHRTMQFGSLQLPVAGLQWLATSPECRGQGLGRHLLAAAERQMVHDGALLGLLRTSIPHFFRPMGWAVCGRHDYSRADVRAVLARLLDQGLSYRRRRSLSHIRPWRRWEQAALVRIYNQNILGGYGAVERTEAYWQWLVRRHAYDQIYVALEGPDLLDLREISTRIVGYAVTHGEQIVELLTAPDRPRAAIELLARACGDAIEHDRHCVLLHARAACPLHDVFFQAGGLRHQYEADHGEVYMVRLLEPLKLLRRLAGEFTCRAAQAGLPRPLELGLLVESTKYQLEVHREGTRIVPHRVGRSYLRMNVADFTRLALGALDWDRAVQEGRLEVSTALAQNAGRILFPSLPLWRPPLDDLRA